MGDGRNSGSPVLLNHQQIIERWKTDMTTMVEAYALAQTLRDRGAVQEALEIAQLGLTLPFKTSGEADASVPNQWK